MTNTMRLNLKPRDKVQIAPLHLNQARDCVKNGQCQSLSPQPPADGHKSIHEPETQASRREPEAHALSHELATPAHDKLPDCSLAHQPDAPPCSSSPPTCHAPPAPLHKETSARENGAVPHEKSLGVHPAPVPAPSHPRQAISGVSAAKVLRSSTSSSSSSSSSSQTKKVRVGDLSPSEIEGLLSEVSLCVLFTCVGGGVVRAKGALGAGACVNT
jgi:hypothetical protein